MPQSDESNTHDRLPWGEGARTVASLLLFIHLFSIVAVLSANLVPSALQQQLVRVVALYARTLNFDPNFTRYHLTHGIDEHDDHFIEVASGGEQLARLPGRGWRGSPSYKRQQRLAAALAFHANREVDNFSAAFARAVGARVIDSRGLPRVVLRCQVHRAQPMDLEQQPVDPFDPAYVETVYEADVWRSGDGSVQILKRAPEREVAPTIDEAT